MSNKSYFQLQSVKSKYIWEEGLERELFDAKYADRVATINKEAEEKLVTLIHEFEKEFTTIKEDIKKQKNSVTWRTFVKNEKDGWKCIYSEPIDVPAIFINDRFFKPKNTQWFKIINNVMITMNPSTCWHHKLISNGTVLTDEIVDQFYNGILPLGYENFD